MEEDREAAGLLVEVYHDWKLAAAAAAGDEAVRLFDGVEEAFGSNREMSIVKNDPQN